MVQESAKGSLFLMLGQMASTLINAFGVIIVARILGSASYGLINIAIIPINLSLLLINNGVSTAVTNFIASDRHRNEGENVPSIILCGYIINLSAGFISFLVIMFSAGYLANDYFARPELTPLIRILSLSILGQALYTTSLSILVGFEHVEHQNIMSILYSLLKSFIAPLLVYIGYGVIGAAYGSTIPIIVTSLIGFLLVLNNLKKIPYNKYNFGYIKQIAQFSGPIFVSAILSGIFLQALNFILPLYVSSSDIGNYSAATNFNVLISFVLAPVSTAMFPLLSKLSPSDRVFKTVYNNIIKYETIAAYCIAGAIITLSSQFIKILYGPDYPLTILYVQIIMLNYIFIGVGGSVNNILLNSQKRTDIQLRRTLIYLVFGIPMGILLIPRFGVIGFIATTVLAPRIGLLYTIIWIRRNLDISVEYMSTGKIAISAIISILVCKLFLVVFTQNIWIEFISGGLVFVITYAVSILYTGALTKRNIVDIKRITDQNKLGRIIAAPILEYIIKIARKG